MDKNIQIMILSLAFFIVIMVVALLIVKMQNQNKNEKSQQEQKEKEEDKDQKKNITNQIGELGEILIRKILIDGGFGSENNILNNIYVPHNGKTSEVDVLLIHETGLYVFESKNFSGWIFGSENDYMWTQAFNRNAKEKFYNPIKQNITHINALSEFLKIDKNKMKSYIVFSERCELKKIPENTDKYKILKRNSLHEFIKNDIEQSEKIFTEEEIKNIYEKLKQFTGISEELKKYI